MQSAFEIPLTPEPQRFSIRLAGKDYRVTLRWFDPPATLVDAGQPAGWALDLADDSDAATPLLAGLPLVTGINLLEQYSYLGIGGALYIFTDGDSDAVPTLTSLGSESRLFFVTDYTEPAL